MSGNNKPPANKQVVDDEGTVDQKLKNEILKARNRVESSEHDIFVRGPMEGVAYPRDQLAEIWKTSVRQYIRRVEPLLQSDEIAGAQEYYLEKPVTSRPVYPLDGETPVHGGDKDTIEIQWSALYRDAVDMDQLRRMDDRFGNQFTPPDPKTYTLVGLRDVIEKPEQTFEWTVELGNAWNPRKNMVATPKRTVSMNKKELERAVRFADQFLQHEAGIAIDVGHQEKDEREMNPV